jgi:hypothetical protein
MNFLNPLFFIGALAAAVPILLHLIRREHARKLEFPTLMFLRKISKKTIRYQKLRHLLLLLLRVLALILIVLAFTRPYSQSAQAPAAIGRVTATHIILIDNSMSMGYEDRWDRAKAAASDIVRSSGPGDKFAVLEFSDSTTALTQLTTSSSEALSQIKSGVELSDKPTRYGQALRAAEKFAMDSGTGKRIIHLISDFQKSGWAAEEQDFRLGAGIELQHVDVGSDDFSNLAIREIRVIEPDAGGGMIIKASPVNFGVKDRKNIRLSLFLDGRMITEKRVDLLKGASQGVEFQIPGLIVGVHPVAIEIEDPELVRDNRFYMTLESRGKTPVIVVENEDAGKRRSSNFFLSNALNIDALSPYKLTVASLKSLAISGELLIWNNTPGGDQNTQRKLQDFVRSGGGLALVLADSSQFADFNRSFGSWLPVKAEPSTESHRGARPADNYVLMTNVKMDHPVFRPFATPHSGNFSGARFFNHAKLTVGPGAETPAAFDNGDPALVTMNIGKGRVLVFASSADDESNDLPLKAVYAPLWQQMLRYLENFREKRQWLSVGDALAPKKLLADTALRQAKGNTIPSEAVVVLDPNKQRVAMAPGSDAVVADRAGFYEIRTVNLNSIVAVNPSARESDLAHGNAEEMAAGWMSHNAGNLNQDERRSPEEQDRRQHIWSMLLVAAILLLLSELFLSNLRLTTDNLRFETKTQSSIVNRQS